MIPAQDLAELEKSVGPLDDAAKARVGAHYREDGCYIGGDYERKIIDWFNSRDRPGYGNSIVSAQKTYAEIKDYARPDSLTAQTTLAEINILIKETFRQACDRYEDWASD